MARAVISAGLLALGAAEAGTAGWQLSTPKASQSAQDLFNRLLAQWGAGNTLSGHTDNLFNDLVSVVGKRPAIQAFDFQNYSPHNPWHQDWSSWDDHSVDNAISWYQSTGQQGIVTFQWHWFSPLGGNLSTSTFYSQYTNFDTSKAVIPGTAEYNAVIRDLDTIAVQIAKLRDAGVPILWRPLHEAGGNQWGAWFWWGRAGPTVCKQLYDMMRDRFINHHGLNNLIWVWSEPKPEWYPGNDKVDILGYDSYIGAYNYDCDKQMWDQYLSMTGWNKMLALTEVGPVPNPADCQNQGIKWLYFLTWGAEARKENTDQHLQEVYSNPRVKSLGEFSDVAAGRSAAVVV